MKVDEQQKPNKKPVEDSTIDATKTKKQKTMLPESPDNEWPECWVMPDGECPDQKAENRKEPNEPVSVDFLRKLGISYWKMDADSFTYPKKAIPWDPSEAVDPRLAKLRDDRGYSYADIITVHPDHLPGYEDKVKAFFEEHIHDAEEIRYIVGGSGYFDVRDTEDRWIRIWIKKGDLMTLPEGIYHRFTTDKTDMIHAMRLFIGQPVWTPFNRPCNEHESRKKYVKAFMGGKEVEEKKEE